MSEAVYYLLTQFKSENEAIMAEKRARAVLDELAKFHDDWQKIRANHDIGTAERHKTLCERYPLVANFIDLPTPPESDPPMNYLAGRCEMNEDYDMRQTSNKKIFLACEVWHFAEWENIADFFYKLGAEKVVWVDEESIDPFRYLELEMDNLTTTALDADVASKKIPEETLKRELDPHIVAEKIRK